MSCQAPYPESPYHRIYTKNRSFSQLRPGPIAPCLLYTSDAADEL